MASQLPACSCGPLWVSARCRRSPAAACAARSSACSSLLISISRSFSARTVAAYPSAAARAAFHSRQLRFRSWGPLVLGGGSAHEGLHLRREGGHAPLVGGCLRSCSLQLSLHHLCCSNMLYNIYAVILTLSVCRMYIAFASA